MGTNFNGNISNWDVSNVGDMQSMFLQNHAFNQDISKWKTGKVRNMYQMFQNATLFNSDLSTWDVSSVTNMGNMFYGATMFNSDLLIWDISKVTIMSNMFRDAISFKQDLCPWGYILQKNLQGNKNVQYDNIFYNTRCNSTLNPIIDTTLSNGFCAGTCPLEKDFKFAKTKTEEKLESIEKTREQKKQEHHKHKKNTVSKIFIHMFFILLAVGIIIMSIKMYNSNNIHNVRSTITTYAEDGTNKMNSIIRNGSERLTPVINDISERMTNISNQYNYSNAYGLIDTSQVNNYNRGATGGSGSGHIAPSGPIPSAVNDDTGIPLSSNYHDQSPDTEEGIVMQSYYNDSPQIT